MSITPSPRYGLGTLPPGRGSHISARWPVAAGALGLLAGTMLALLSTGTPEPGRPAEGDGTTSSPGFTSSPSPEPSPTAGLPAATVRGVGFPAAAPVTKEALSRMGDGWALELASFNWGFVRSNPTSAANAVLYLVEPSGVRWEVMDFPTWNDSRLNLVTWDAKSGEAIVIRDVHDGSDQLLLVDVPSSAFTTVAPPDGPVGTFHINPKGQLPDGRTIWTIWDSQFTDFTFLYDPAAGWTEVAASQGVESGFANGSLAPGGDWWVFQPTSDGDDFTIVNLVTGATATATTPSGYRYACAALWADRTTLRINCRPNGDLPEATFVTSAPDFPPLVESVAATETVAPVYQVPGTPLIISAAPGDGTLTGVGVLTTDGPRVLAEFPSSVFVIVNSVREGRPGVYVLSGDGRSDVFVDVVTGEVSAFTWPELEIPAGADVQDYPFLRSRVVYVAPDEPAT